ncbi:DUF1566 domain-containing protein [Ectothiorhodospira sp. BSL-9]|uniref:Lcl C-terminal domain-containing protein n=1 Tax=Ectothiorhodospira sp. BSL-9 TaxID=1442136 RepID=UPI0007B4FA27
MKPGLRAVIMKPGLTRVRWLLTICLVLFSTGVAADIPSAANECVSDLLETTPSSDFRPVLGGMMVYHEPTELFWLRCPVGMSWTGTDCAGSASMGSWGAALEFAEQEGSAFRVPSISELRSIVELCKTGPAVNEEVFPGTPSDRFWSATPFLLSGKALGVSFDSGSDAERNMIAGAYLRLVVNLPRWVLDL